MLRAILKFLGHQPGEEKQMTLLLGKGFFTGILLATYKIGAETLLITILGEAWLDEAIFSAGLAGIIATTLFVFLQKKINYSTLVLSTTFIILLFILGLRIAFGVIGYDAEVYGKFQILPFIYFIMIGPITSIIFLGFWGIFGRIFNLRQSKRIIGGIDSGQLLATLIAFFSIPILLGTLQIRTFNLLWVSSGASLGVFIFTLLLVINFNLDRSTRIQKGDEVAHISFLTIFKNKYYRLLTIFLIFSMAAAVFMNYTFLSATETMYSEETDLSTFLSFFSATVIIVSFLIQSFLNDFIIGKFGLNVALMTMPFILALFTAGAIIAGHFYVYDIKTPEYILFFVLISTGRLFSASLKEALENPAFKLFFLPIDIKIRFDIQTRIEGVVNEIAIFIAGAVQIALGFLAFIKLIHYSYFILALSGGIIILASKLYEEYKKKLKSILVTKKVDMKDDVRQNKSNVIHILRGEVRRKNIGRVLNAIKLLENLEPIEFEYTLLDLLNHRRPVIRKLAYQKLGDRFCWEMLEIINKELKTEGDEDVLKVARQTIKKLNEALAFKLTDKNLLLLIRSTDPNKRIRGAQLLAKIEKDQHSAYLGELLRDINPRVRTAAIISAGKSKQYELWSLVLENLHLPAYGNVAMSALKAAGENAFHTLDAAFYKTGQYHATMVRIIQVYGNVVGSNSIEVLWKKIDYPGRKILSQILSSLSNIGFSAKEFQVARIKIAIESEIGDIAWNIKSALDIPRHHPMDKMLRSSMVEEDTKKYDNIFMLLSMVYDPQSVLLTKENIQDGTTESITIAVEMLDIFIDEELKSKIIPIMDDLNISDRLKKLQNHYPPEYFKDYQDLLLQMINRDYNKINHFTKALAMLRFGQLSKRVPMDIVANLFNKDPLLLQTAAYVIYKIDKRAYHRHTKRLKASIKKEIDKAILPPVFKEKDEIFHQKMLLIERAIFIKKMKEFSKIPGEVITYFSERFEEIIVDLGTMILRENDLGIEPLYIVVEGFVDIYEGEQKVKELGKGGLFGESTLLVSEKNNFTALARTECKLLVLKKNDLLDMMSHYVEILNCWINHLNRVATEENKIVNVLYE